MMTQKEADLVNELIAIETQIQTLWEYHPDNPDRIDVEFEFQNLQREALSIQSALEEENFDDRDISREEELPF